MELSSAPHSELGWGHPGGLGVEWGPRTEGTAVIQKMRVPSVGTQPALGLALRGLSACLGRCDLAGSPGSTVSTC